MNIQVIILAAGRGERMRSAFPYPKALVPINGIPMIVRLLQTLLGSRLIIENILIVVRPEEEALFREEMSRYFPRARRLRWVVQQPCDGYGTASGVQAVLRSGEPLADRVMIMNSDTPFLSAGSLEKMASSTDATTDLCVGSVFVEGRGYGRVVRSGDTVRIVEQKEIDILPEDHEWRGVCEANTGVYLARGAFLGQAREIVECPVTHEKKLTDLCGLARSVRVFSGFSALEVLNVNSPLDRNYAEYILSKERNDLIDSFFFRLLQ
jgi:bifunctional N-acetylglucosamine-1-phosphate-uridyltransferase/glucosamine-1-phosphate-acetyltransferase GlmU-like protein